jgi:nucleoside-diphosphate-sugar epimerase
VRDALRTGLDVIALTECTQLECGVPPHPAVTWIEADLRDPDAARRGFAAASEHGPVEFVLLLPLPGADLAPLAGALELCHALRPTRVVVATDAKEPPQPGLKALLERHRARVSVSQVEFAPRPRLVLLGASGFIGRQLLEGIRNDYEVFALARSARETCGVPDHPNVTWIQTDITDAASVDAAFERIRAAGGAEFVVHLAAYYDFTGEDHPEYRRTNVDGLRAVLDACRALRPRLFVFASSVAACAFPRPGAALTEDSPADGDHAYAVSKRVGEAMLAEYADAFPSVVVRLGAIYSDWCEYPPLFVLLERWRSASWDRRILGGRGLFGVPYLHLRDVESFFVRLLARAEEWAPGEVLIASADGAVTIRELFREATRGLTGDAERPVVLPRWLCALGLAGRAAAGRLLGSAPFEKPWMARYIDRQLAVDARRTRERLGWSPRERLELLRRLPFLVEHMRNESVEWERRNLEILRRRRPAANLRIHRLLEQHEAQIIERLGRRLAAGIGGDGAAPRGEAEARELAWSLKVALHQMMAAVRTQDAMPYLSFCRDLAARLFDEGWTAPEASALLRALTTTAAEVLADDPAAAGLDGAIAEAARRLALLGCDQVEESFDQLARERVFRAVGRSTS